MAGMNTINGDVLIRSELWSNQLKRVLEDELNAVQYVNWIDFPDGNTMTVPSIGTLDASDYVEDTAIEYTPMDLGEFQFSITQYKQSATYITNKQRQDSYVSAQLEAAFVPSENRAILTALEIDILSQGQPGTPNGQTASNANKINGADHRWVGGTVVNGNDTLGFKDFAKARYSLKKANVPDTNLIAIVDPSVEYTFSTLNPTLDVTYNPMWEGIVSSGLATGMRFSRNIYGFDVYVSNYLPTITTAETINTKTASVGAVANLFFSAAPGMEKPFIGAMRQAPKVDGEYNKDFQREEYVTTARWGVKLYRNENFITVLSETDVIV
jgi:HK97 family phage major capsid protein